jgi:thioester reductase-like protein
MSERLSVLDDSLVTVEGTSAHTHDGRGRGAIFLTGATGFLGMELLARYLERTDRHVYALVRPAADADPDERLRAVIEELGGDPDVFSGRWSAVAGDVEAPGLGIEPARRRDLAAEVGDVVHSAASVSFSLPLEEARRTNVVGTRRLLEFAELCRERGGLQKFAYVSTAYVAGDHPGRFGEDELEVGQEFRNSYERSKFEAERLVREQADRLPVQIFRPSIIVGEQRSGWTTSFNVLYPPLKGFAAGAYPLLPARPETPVDVVPVDYVADAIFELAERRPGHGEVLHLVAGERATTVGRLAERAGRYFGRRPPRVMAPRLYRRLIHPLLVWASRGPRRRALRMIEPLLPYFQMRVRFDDRRSRERLEPAGISPPAPERYFDRLLDFAVAARWGKRRLTRAQADRLGATPRSLWASR